MHGSSCKHATTHVWRSEKLWSQFVLSAFVWVAGIKLTPSSLWSECFLPLSHLVGPWVFVLPGNAAGCRVTRRTRPTSNECKHEVCLLCFSIFLILLHFLEMRPSHVAQSGLKVLILLPQFLYRWLYRCVPPCLTQAIAFLSFFLLLFSSFF